MVISRILHAGYLFESGETRLLFDPIFENPFSVNCFAFPDVRFDLQKIQQLQVDGIFISHFHDDHCSFESLRLLDRRIPIWIYCLHEELLKLLRELGFSQVQSLSLDEPVQFGPLRVTPRMAADSEVDCIFQIETGDLKVLNVVDAVICEKTLAMLAAEAPWDLVLWPFQTLRETDVIAPSRATPISREIPSEWIQQLRLLNPRFVIPSSCQFRHESWSWSNHAMFPITYARFAQEIEIGLPQVEVRRLDPAKSFRLSKKALEPAGDLDFVIPVGEQNVDYPAYSSLQRPTTREIAARLGPLTEAQTEQTLKFCRTEIQNRYFRLGPPAESYFQRSRTWRLRLYSQGGEVSEWNYLLDEDQMRLLPIGDSTPDWLTEVPLTKLHNALFEGESLSSMYVRINDAVFDLKIEREIRNADVMDDPLIRCLFGEAFASYQRAQLHRIREGSAKPPRPD